MVATINLKPKKCVLNNFINCGRPNNMFKRPKFTIFRGEDEKFYFNLAAPNGEIILSSQGYSSKQAAKNGIKSVRKNSVVAKIVEK